MRKGGLEPRERRTVCRDKELLSQRLKPAVGWFELEGSELCALSSFSSFLKFLGKLLLSLGGLRNFSIPVTETVVLTGSHLAAESCSSEEFLKQRDCCLVDELRIQIRSHKWYQKSLVLSEAIILAGNWV